MFVLTLRERLNIALGFTLACIMGCLGVRGCGSVDLAVKQQHGSNRAAAKRLCKAQVDKDIGMRFA